MKYIKKTDNYFQKVYKNGKKVRCSKDKYLNYIKRQKGGVIDNLEVGYIYEFNAAYTEIETCPIIKLYLKIMELDTTSNPDKNVFIINIMGIDIDIKHKLKLNYVKHICNELEYNEVLMDLYLSIIPLPNEDIFIEQKGNKYKLIKSGPQVYLTLTELLPITVVDESTIINRFKELEYIRSDFNKLKSKSSMRNRYIQTQGNALQQSAMRYARGNTNSRSVKKENKSWFAQMLGF